MHDPQNIKSVTIYDPKGSRPAEASDISGYLVYTFSVYIASEGGQYLKDVLDFG